MLTSSIVLYHTPKPQITALLSCVDTSLVDSIYVVDNSPDDRYRILERQSAKIRYIHNKNLGYGASHNLAMLEAIEAGSDYHLILNPDIYFTPDTLDSALSYMQSHIDVAYLLPKVLSPDGELQHLCKLLPTPFDLIFRRFIPNTRNTQKWNDRYVLKESGYNKIINPPCLSGCFMFLRLSVIKEHGIFFDERYFMYCEDFDLIRRLHRVAKTIYYPDISIIHDHAKQSYKSKKMLFEHIKSAIKYFNKWGWFFDKERREMNSRILAEINQKQL
jgi:GT2 family glycosyltransferase